jgi:hypothetical protein
MAHDSLGTAQLIRPGDVNWMVAGRGIAHSERTPPEQRQAASGAPIHGIQTWIALPAAHEETRPSFSHHPAPSLPGFVPRRAPASDRRMLTAARAGRSLADVLRRGDADRRDGRSPAKENAPRTWSTARSKSQANATAPAA